MATGKVHSWQTNDVHICLLNDQQRRAAWWTNPLRSTCSTLYSWPCRAILQTCVLYYIVYCNPSMFIGETHKTKDTTSISTTQVIHPTLAIQRRLKNSNVHLIGCLWVTLSSETGSSAARRRHHTCRRTTRNNKSNIAPIDN